MGNVPTPVWVNLALVAILFLVMRQVFRQRAWLASHAREIENLAKRRGYTYQARLADEEVRALGVRVRLFQSDARNRIDFRNVVTGTVGEVGFRMVDYRKTSQSPNGGARTVTAYGMVIFDEIVPLPNFSLGPRLPWVGVKMFNWMLQFLIPLMTQRSGASGPPRFYDLEEMGGGILAKLAGKYYQIFAEASSEQELRAIASPRTMEFLGKNPGWIIQLDNGVLTAYKGRRLASAEKYDDVLTKAVEIKALITEAVSLTTPARQPEARRPA